jgi:acetyltransferase-like isoleucine patch superfamily enzyme
MWKLLLKNPAVKWMEWFVNAIRVKSKFPTAKLYYGASATRSFLGKGVTLFDNVTMTNCIVGDFTYIQENSRLHSTKIGKFTAIGPGVRVGMGNHPSQKFVTIHPMFYSDTNLLPVTFASESYFPESKDSSIGNDVWIGAHALIMDGVVIGDGAIVAAGAVVTENVLPYSIVGGVPARFIKYRFAADQIEYLLEFMWWNKEIPWMKKNWRLWHDIETFIDQTKEAITGKNKH